MNYNKILLLYANKALNKNEIPVSAIVVLNNKIIGIGYNKRHLSNKISNHAEIIAIENAAKKIKTWHLNDCDLYVTMEPCKMCCGAIEQAHIKNVYYFLNNKKFGDVNNLKYSNFKQINDINFLNEYKKILNDFFKFKRK